MSLIDKIRKAREIGVEAGGHQFTIRRPTDEEALALADKESVFQIARRFTIGWDLTELDLIPGGSPDKVPFDPALFAEWAADQTEVCLVLGNAAVDAYASHTSKRAEALKN